MRPAFTARAIIDRPPDQVWETLTRWNDAARWMKGVEGVRADGGTEVGTTLTFRARGKERQAEIARCEPGRAIVLRSVQGGVTADYTYKLEPIGGGATRVTLTAECATRGLGWRLLGPMIRLAIRLSDGKQLEALKQVAEG